MKNMNTTVYDPKEVHTNVSGIPMTGFADGDKISVEPVTKENFKSHCGVDGDVTVTKVNDPRYLITLRFKPSSPSNAILQGLMMSPSLFPLSIKNLKGGAYIGGATKCVIAEKPVIKFGAEEQMKEWKVLATDYSDVQITE